MITIITALYSEAKPFLEQLSLKKKMDERLLTLFEGQGIRVLLTGVGQIPACMAVTRYFTLFPPAKTDIAANVGVAGCVSSSKTDGTPALGSCHLAVSLSEISTGRTFFPDLLYQNSFTKAHLLTSPAAVTKRPAKDVSCHATLRDAAPALPNAAASLPLLIDMEAAGIYQAALPYLSTERMFFFKTISDYITASGNAWAESENAVPQRPPLPSAAPDAQISPDALIAPYVPGLLRFLRMVQAAVSKEPSGHPIAFSKEEQAAIDRLLLQLPLTASMQEELFRLLRYHKLSKHSVTELLEQFLCSLPPLPLHGKKQTKPYLDHLTEQVWNGAFGKATLPILPKEDAQDRPGASFRTKQESSYLPFFSTVYVEWELWDAWERRIPKQLLAHTEPFAKNSKPITVIPIKHYKDVFNRSRQNFTVQKHSPALILANNHGTLLYPGAPVCQSFGNEHFYYASTLMNCIYNCDYCYLQGMYPSGHIVAFMNLEDYFAETAKVLKKHPAYLCISYDTDLLALEPLFSFTKRWVQFAKHHPGLTLEIRTKSGNPSLFPALRSAWDAEAVNTPKEDGFAPPNAEEDASKACSLPDNLVFAWTVSPEELSRSTEHGAAPLLLRLAALRAAKDAGFSVRLCFDPMIYAPGWQEAYQKLVSQIFGQFTPKLSAAELRDISIGVFRISTEYLKAMKKRRPDSPIVQFPYVSEKGVSHYGSLSEKMVQYLRGLLLPYIPAERIFIWDGKEPEQPNSAKGGEQKT